jgi:hypothetical protein
MKDDDEFAGRDSWGELNQPRPQHPAKPEQVTKRERQATVPFALERPSTKMIAVGYKEPVSKTFKKPTDSPRPSRPSVPEPEVQPLLPPLPKAPDLRQQLITWLNRWHMTRWLARLLGA